MSLSSLASFSARPRMPVNPFQRMMRAWSRHAPYSGLHMIRVEGPPDAARWQQAANFVLKRAGIGQPHYGDDFCVFDDRELVVRDYEGTLEHWIEQELALPFADADVPIRFSCVHHGRHEHTLGITYDHWPWDSVSIRALLHRVFAEFAVPFGSERLPRLTIGAPSFEALFGHKLNEGRVLPLTAEFSSNVARGAVISHLVELPASSLEAARACARRCHATTHDLFQAAMAQAIARFEKRVGRALVDSGDDGIRIGTIVDIRPASAVSLDNVIGMFLSCFVSSVRNADERTLSEITREISLFTSKVKENDAVVRNYNTIMQRLHAKASTGAALSNVNLTDSWMEQSGTNGLPRILSYKRGAPPRDQQTLGFCITTFSGRIDLCGTARLDLMTRSELADLSEDFAELVAAASDA